MTFANHRLSLLQPLSAGNVLNVALQLYRRHFKEYLKIAAIATLWGLLPIFAGLILLLFLGANPQIPGVLILVFPIWLVAALFCLGMNLTKGAALSRLVFAELLQSPETPAEAQRYTRSRLWRFLFATLLVTLLLIAVLVVGYLTIIIVGISIFGLLGGVSAITTLGAPDPGALLIGVGVSVVLLLLMILFFVWVSVRLAIYDMPLAIEPEATASNTISRSWELTHRSFWRLALVSFGALLITLPLSVVSQLLATIAQGVVAVALPDDSITAGLLAFLVGWGIGLSIGAFILPFGQAIRAVFYFDLRNRREGLGLTLPPRQDKTDAVSQSLFNQVSVRTPESVALEFTLAGLGNRTLALVIDYHVLGLLLAGFLLLWLLFSTQLMEYLSRLDGNFSGVSNWLLAIALLVGFTIYTGYFVFFESTQRGQTPGKRFTQSRVIRDDGRPIGLSQAVMRALLRPIDDFFFIGVLFILGGKQEKRIGDLVAGTLVIQEERPQVNSNFTISKEGRAFARKLPELVQVSPLLPDEFAVVRTYLQRRSTLSARTAEALSQKLAGQVNDILQIEPIPSNLSPDQLLEAVYLGYQAQARRQGIKADTQGLVNE